MKTPPVTPIAMEARRQGALLDLDKHNWPWSMMLVPVMGIDLFELTNNHLWRTDFKFRNWYPEYIPEYMGIELGESQVYTERDWISFGLQNYYALLNCGFDLKPSAGTASGVHPVPIGFGRVYVHQPDGFSYKKWIQGLKAGRSFVTTGPMLMLEIDGKEPGSQIAINGEHEAKVVIRGYSAIQSTPTVELIINGERIDLKHSGFDVSINKTPLRMEYTARGKLKINGSAWVAARFFQEDGGRPRFAHTAPINYTDSQSPLRPKRQEVQYLIGRIEDELSRHENVLSKESLDEFHQAHKIYQSLLKTSR